MKTFLADKSYGFFMSVFVFLFSLATALVYGISYSSSSDLSRPVYLVILAGAGAALILALLRRYNWIPVVLALGNFAALLLFIKAIYFYVSVVLYGINGSAFSPAFLASTVCLALALVFSIANIFMKQVKE